MNLLWSCTRPCCQVLTPNGYVKGGRSSLSPSLCWPIFWHSEDAPGLDCSSKSLEFAVRLPVLPLAPQRVHCWWKPCRICRSPRILLGGQQNNTIYIYNFIYVMICSMQVVPPHLFPSHIFSVTSCWGAAIDSLPLLLQLGLVNTVGRMWRSTYSLFSETRYYTVTLSQCPCQAWLDSLCNTLQRQQGVVWASIQWDQTRCMNSKA